MPEPTSTSVGLSTLVATGLSSTAVTAFGVPLGLHADVLCAGFSGALAAIILLNSVPGSTDSWRELVKTTTRRMAVVATSSLTAGYITPLMMLSASIPMEKKELVLASAFVVGCGAQKLLAMFMRKFAKPTKNGGQA
ncbi:hypothetical protein [Comamonas sp. HJ-2]|mgnify:CR=1 FL=1